MPVPWNDDPAGSAPRIAANLKALLGAVAPDHRETPSVARAQDWHQAIYAGVGLPVEYYAGEFRDSDARFPELIGYEVVVGSHPGVPSAEVPTQLAAFEQQVINAFTVVDGAIPSGSELSHDTLHSVLVLMASVHGEWVRIHPFANGNGRTARIWANWTALRYGLDPFVTLKPRPTGIGYQLAAYRSMRGDHSLLIGVFAQMLTEHLRS